MKTPQRKVVAPRAGIDSPASLLPFGDASRYWEEANLGCEVTLINTWISTRLPIGQITEITQLATVVFGDQTVATSWLREPNLATDNQSPISLLGTPNGFERVKNFLLRIQYGVLA